MNKRYHCVFKNCYCDKYKKHINKKCKTCNHSIVWHSLKEKPPCDGYLSFLSTRSMARKPIYIKTFVITLFEPLVPPLPISSDDEMPYCSGVEVLPV
jgi:hypothetical protein